MVLNRSAKLRAFAILLFLYTTLNGCAHPGSLSALNDDALNVDQGFESVVFWRVKVLDKTGTITSRPRFSIERAGLSNGRGRSAKPPREKVAVDGEWTKRDGASVFESVVFAAAKPEEYLFKDVTFFLYTDYLPNYYTGRDEERDVFFTVPLSRLCVIAAGKLVYLGEIEIEFLKEEKTGYTYRVDFVQENTDFNDAAKDFRETYPGLFRRFNGTVEPVSWKIALIENFSANESAWTVAAGDKRVHTAFNNGKYVIQTKNDGCHSAKLTPSLPRPQNFYIELMSTSNSKTDVLGHGLILGDDQNNGYRFLVDGLGRAKIERYKNGDLGSALIPWKAGAAGNAVETMVSRQKIEARGAAFRYYVNGQFVGEIKNELDLKGWFLGLGVCGKQAVEFDQLKLVEQ